MGILSRIFGGSGATTLRTRKEFERALEKRRDEIKIEETRIRRILTLRKPEKKFHLLSKLEEKTEESKAEQKMLGIATQKLAEGNEVNEVLELGRRLEEVCRQVKEEMGRMSAKNREDERLRKVA